MVAACKPLLWIVWPVPGCIYTFAHLPGLQGVPLPLLLTHVDAVRVSILLLSSVTLVYARPSHSLSLRAAQSLSLLDCQIRDHPFEWRNVRYSAC